ALRHSSRPHLSPSKKIVLIVLKFDELLGNNLDAMPTAGPVLRSMMTEHRQAMDSNAGRLQGGPVHERRPLAAERRRDDQPRPYLLARENVAHLTGRVQTIWLYFPYGNDLQVL